MKDQDLTADINEASKIAKELYDLLHDDALHRLCLYQEYSHDKDTTKWNPNLYRRCQLAELLYKKLISLNIYPYKDRGFGELEKQYPPKRLAQ